MRFGFDIQYLHGGAKSGIFVYVRSLIEALGRTDDAEKIRLFSLVDSKGGKKELVRRNQQIGEGVGRMRFEYYRHPGWAYRLRTRLSSLGRVSVFHHTGPCFPPVDGAANVFTVFDLTPTLMPDFHTDANRDHFGTFAERAMKHHDMVITSSEHSKRDIIATMGIHPDRVRVTPLAPGPHFRPSEDPDGLAADLDGLGLRDTRYILSVGTLEPRKNLPTLIRAFARLKESHPGLPHKLVLAGAKGWKYEAIFEAIERSGVASHVVVLGHAGRLESLYQGADLMVFPSFYEGFGIPPLEAMACGTPVITSNTSSLPEVVGDAGIMVDPHDEEGLREAMSHVLSDPAKREAMRRAGMARAALFSWDHTAQATLAAYREAHRIRN